MFAVHMPLPLLTEALRFTWCAETSRYPDQWHKQNPARGNCVPSALVVQDYYGGELEKVEAHLETGEVEAHYRNILDGNVRLDTTEQQYPPGTFFTIREVALGTFESIREKRLADAGTLVRYELLREGVELYVAAPQILYNKEHTFGDRSHFL